MELLEIWNHPELFEKFKFSDIDRKAKVIHVFRYKYDLCNKVLKELNNRIDIDYIKGSDLIEGIEVRALQDINFDEDFEELYETDIFNKKVKNASIDDFFFGKYRTIIKDGKLSIYRKDPETDVIRKFSCSTPKHLETLKYALATARQDRLSMMDGKKVDVTVPFIEKLHEMLFKDHIMINTVFDRARNIVKPEGYGKLRRTIEVRGREHKYNVVVEGVDWTPTDSDYVREEMEKLVECYNNSKLHPIIKAILFKACFIKIHPFRDGNGRTSRILLNYMLVRNGYPTVTIRGTHKNQYFSAMNEAIMDNDFTNLVKIIKKELNQRCEQYTEIIKKLDLQNNHEEGWNI